MAAPAGVVLVFRDVTERERLEREGRDALAYAEEIISTLREPFLVLDKALNVKSANAAFYQTFRVPKDETEGRSLYDLGDAVGQVPALAGLVAAEPLRANPHDLDDLGVAAGGSVRLRTGNPRNVVANKRRTKRERS